MWKICLFWLFLQCLDAKALEEKPHLLNEIEMSLDHTQDPCEDFYAYSCNNWAEHHPDTRYAESTGLVDNIMNLKLINLLESGREMIMEHSTRHRQHFTQMAVNYYESCAKEKSSNFSRYFERIKPGENLEWPVLEELQAPPPRGDLKVDLWPAQGFDVFGLLGRLQSYGLNNVLINQDVAQTQNGSMQIILDMPEIAPEGQGEQEELLIFSYFLKNAGLPKIKYLDYVKQVKRTGQHWQQVYRNYTTATSSEQDQEEEEEAAKKLTFQKLQQLFPKLATFLENLQPSGSATRFKPQDTVAIYNMEYFQYLMEKPMPARIARKLCNYLMMKFLSFLLKDSSDSFTKLDCIRDVRNKMDLAVNYLYRQHIVADDFKEYFQDMSQLSHKLFKYYLQTLEENPLRLSGEQLDLLKLKLYTLRLNLGNLPQQLIYPRYHNDTMPQPPFNPEEIEKFYQDIPPLDPSNYYQNHLELLRHRFAKSLIYEQNYSYYISTDNKIGSTSTPIYYARQNMILLFQGFLQDPIYNLDMEPLAKWSLLAFILAHEFTHAIDSSGMYFGPDGHILDSDRGIQDHTNFTNALECLQHQLPTDAIDERIADLMGARVAFNAYIKDYNWQTGSEHSSIGWKKLFFLNMSQFFCGRKGVQFRDHDSDADRLHQILMNLEGFAEAFQCEVGTPMNPTEKCRVY
uniref:Peptidase family M13 n=1 Tax=Musca domestica TaxID=7370 RepID=A0A1I8N0H5_MUSDO